MKYQNIYTLKYSKKKFGSRLHYIAQSVLLTAVFFSISLPSIKLFYSSEIINAIPILLFLTYIVLNPSARLVKHTIIILLPWLAFSIAMVTHLTLNPESAKTVIRTIYFLILVFFAIILPAQNIVKNISLSLIIWGATLSILQISIGIDYSSELGQTYLTIGLPIGITLTLSLTYLFIANSFLEKLIFSLISILCLYAISLIKVRAILLFAILTSLSIALLIIFLRKDTNVVKKWVLLFVFINVVLLLTTFVISNIEFSQLYRLERLFNSPGSEPRLIIYHRAFDVIFNNPIFGIGLGAIYQEIGIYPHNIFLEILLSVGIVGGAAIIPIIFIWLVCLFSSFRYFDKYRHCIGIGAASAVTFLQWNTSFDLQTAYIPLILIVIFIKSILEKK